MTTEKFDVMVFLIEAEVEIAAALGAFQPPGEYAGFLCNSRLFAPLHLVGFGVAFEVDDIAAVFLQGEDFLDGGVSSFGRLQGTFGAAAVDSLVPPIVGGMTMPSLPKALAISAKPYPTKAIS